MVQVIEKKRGEKFEVFSTDLPGIQLKGIRGAKISLLPNTLKGFYRIVKNFARNYFQITDLSEKQTPLNEQIIGVAEEYKGLRGLISENDNFGLTVFPREVLIYDREVLKKSLGIAYNTVTREIVVVNLAIPGGFVTGKGITISEDVVAKAIRKALTNLGISKEDLSKVMRQEVKISLDEKKLAEMIDQKRVELPSKAKTKKTTWVVKVDRLKK